MDKIKAAINSISKMSDEEFEFIIPHMTIIKTKKEKNLIDFGHIYKDVYFITEGFFRMYYLDFEGHQVNCRFNGKNSFISDFSSLLTQTPSRYCLQAMSDSELVVIRYSSVLEVFKRSHSWERLGRLMAESFFLELRNRLEMLLFLTPEERYTQLMDQCPDLFNQVSQYHISSFLGIKPESLSRLRKRIHNKQLTGL